MRKRFENLTPYEEINEVNKQLNVLKEVTLKGTDLEYFGYQQIIDLNNISQEIAILTRQMLHAMNEEDKTTNTIEKGIEVEFESHIQHEESISIGSIVEYQGSKIEVTRIDIVAPLNNYQVVVGVGKII